MSGKGAIARVGVLGCGLMGSGIAEVCARCGFETVVREIEPAALEHGLERIGRSLEGAVARGKLSEPARAEALSRLHGTTELADLAACDLIVEAIVERLDAKREALSALDALCGPATVFASNTSSLTIVDIAMGSGRPDRCVGLHFFNPVPVMKLVEVVRTLLTSESTLALAHEFVRALGKDPIDCRDASGFIVNRLLVPYLLDAIRAHEEGLGSIADIDKGMRLGCGHPMGPFELLDFVGLDTTLLIADIMFEEFRERRFAPPPSLKRMVAAGRLGRKSGHGFYDYQD
jgi:3-hydroxybutyryl-CoA dehydrogenase